MRQIWIATCLATILLVGQLPRIIPRGITVLLKRWRQNERGRGQLLHNRYILTDIGGVSFGAGLDANLRNSDRDADDISLNELDTDEVTLLDRETYDLRWDQYAGPNPAFVLAQEPIVIVGGAS
jgi:hypothetical protein